MIKAQGKKARDSRYYQANKEEINRRRRERRRLEKEKARQGLAVLRMVDPMGTDDPSGAPDLCIGSQADPLAKDRWEAQDRDESSELGIVPPGPAATQSGGSASNKDAALRVTSNSMPDEFDAGDTASPDQGTPSHNPLVKSTALQERGPDHDVPNQSFYFAFTTNEEPIMRQIMPLSANVYQIPSSAQASNPETHIEPKLRQNRASAVMMFQLLVATGLTVLSTFLQFEFYNKHDVLPGYAWPLAISGSVAMLSLASTKFPGFWVDLPRKLIYMAFYVFFVLSSSYHVLSDAWEKVAVQSETVSTLPSREPAIEAITKALEKATKGRAYGTMETLGAELSKQMTWNNLAAKPQPMGLSNSSVVWAGAAILVALRALLEAAIVVIAISLKNSCSSY
jgi:hypothetical protein